MPEVGETFKFKDHAATEMAPFVAFYDCESYLITPVDPSNTLHEHYLCAIQYVIVDLENKIVRKRIKVVRDVKNADKVCHEMLVAILKDFKELMIEEAKTWNDTYELTNAERDKYNESTNCCFCKANFKKNNLVKVIHHRWNQKVERGPNNEVLKGNFSGARLFDIFILQGL